MSKSLYKALVVVILVGAVGAIVAMKNPCGCLSPADPYSKSAQSSSVAPTQAQDATVPTVQAPTKPIQSEALGIPRLVDLGADKCIPCKLMAPILEQLKRDFEGKLQVDFIDVWENPSEAPRYGVKIMPTQIFFGPDGNELFRHEGFFSREDILAKWKELGVDLGPSAVLPTLERLEPLKPDTRAKDQICYMCDKDIDPKTIATVATPKGEVRLCGLHCFFILYSCLTEDKTDYEKKVSVADFTTGKPLPVTSAVYLYGVDEKNHRPTIKAFADNAAALAERQASGGNIVAFANLAEQELATRCGFCDRAVYPTDAAAVKVEGLSTWGCCSHCAMGVAARTGKDIEVRQKDGLTGQMIVVKTFSGSVASLDPSTAVAWFGQRKNPEGKWISAGCFHQGFFVTLDNLKKWLEDHPMETGRMITINQALADKMKLTPEQIQKACKIGECAPK
jgi:thioredoxin 1